MATILTTSNPSLLEAGHRKVVSDSYASRPKQYPGLFREMEATMKTETIPHIGAFGLAPSSTEGAPYNEDQITEGYTATFTPTIYNLSYVITNEAIKYDQYGKMKKEALNLGRSMAAREETEAAAVINEGFATTTGYDGVYLFSNSHPLENSASLGDNLTTGALSDANIKAAKILMRSTVNEANIKIMATPDTAWVAANLEWTLATLLESTGEAGATNNNKNVLGNMRRVVMDYLTDSYWGLADSSMETLIMMWYEKTHYGMQDIPNSDDYRFWAQNSFGVGYGDWRGIVGSTGA